MEFSFEMERDDLYVEELPLCSRGSNLATTIIIFTVSKAARH